MDPDWMTPANIGEISSPGVLVYPDRVQKNLRRMVAMVGDPGRLRPHIKTHKLPQILAVQLACGITQCKCATIAEAEMALTAGVNDVLLAAQPVGPNIGRVITLIQKFPAVRLQIVVDDPATISKINEAAVSAGTTIHVLLDLDVGQHRTGAAPGPAACECYQQISKSPGLVANGLHAYDGHVHQPDPVKRSEAASLIYESVSAFRKSLIDQGFEVPGVVMGGTPTFPFYAKHDDVECSPGTCVLWDAGYAAHFPDLEFLHAATLLTRVVSRPGPNLLCLDLGHKAVASEMPQPRVVFPLLPDAKGIAHNEEHLVIETSRAAEYPVGSELLGLPWHICPTMALHATVHVVEHGRVTVEWPVTARQRKLTV